MISRAVILRAAAAALSLLVGSVALGDPPSISGLVSTRPLTTADKGKIKVYAEFWTDQLVQADADPSQMRRVRRALGEPVRRGGVLVSRVFRAEYSSAVLPGLQQAITDGTAQQGVVAAIVLSQVATEPALTILIDHCASDLEPRPYIRLAASRGCSYVLARDNDAIRSRRVGSAIRAIAAAAREEQNGFALRHQVDAILAAGEGLDDAGQRGQAFQLLVDVMETTASRAAARDGRTDPVSLLDALYPCLTKLRTTFISAPVPEQKAIGAALGPCLQELLDVAHAHWAELQDTAKDQTQPAEMIELCEGFLSTVDRFVRGKQAPTTELRKAWDDGDAARYKRDLDRWSEILNKPPY